MAQRAVTISFSDWTQITNIVDEKFTALNKTPQDLHVFFAAVKPVNTEDAGYQDILNASFEADTGKPFQRPDDAPVGSHCFVRFRNQIIDGNMVDAIAVMSP